MSLDDFYLVEKTMRLNVEEGRHEAERRGLAQLARLGEAAQRHFGQRVLGGVGHRLVAWGEGLQERYSARPQPTSHAARRSSPAGP